MRARKFAALATVSFFGAGYAPKAPGTAGSVAALVVLLLPAQHIEFALLAGSAVAFVLGMLFIPSVESDYGNDPPFVVLDEVIGVWLVLATPVVPRTIGWVALALALFRLFDIWKPFPIRWFNERKGGFYVLMDDVAAAVFASVALHGVYAIFASGVLIKL